MLIACPVPDKPKARKLCEAFIRGAPRDAVGFVFYGVKASNFDAYRRAQLSRQPIYYIDNSYFDQTRGLRFRVTKDAIQVQARERTSDCRRFDAMGIELQPWKRRAHGYWLALHQSADHLNIAPNHQRWLQETVEHLAEHSTVMHRGWDRDKAKQVATLPEALAGARGVVTHTSAGAVTAVIVGVPAIVSPQHALAFMTCSDDPATDQRRQFLGVLADHEFTTAELETGTAWRTLNP